MRKQNMFVVFIRHYSLIFLVQKKLQEHEKHEWKNRIIIFMSIIMCMGSFALD